jgi:hypothetical protein
VEGSGTLEWFIPLDGLLPFRGENVFEVRGKMQLADGLGKSYVGDLGLVAERAGKQTLRP